MNVTHLNKVGEIVAENYRTAAIFEKYGIDFCCKGNKSIDEACESKSIKTEDVMRELKIMLSGKDNSDSDYKSWTATQLADHIENKHHRYVEEKIPVLQRYLNKLCSVHGENHPELHEVNRLFALSAGELTQHMKKEELILFPRIRKMENSRATPIDLAAMNAATVQDPIEVMMHEHDTEGERFRTIDILTQNYIAPPDACNTYKVTYALLQEFQNDLHLHIHLENNILFPKAIELENKNSFDPPSCQIR
jgi:regulator of cell morphogenesis and NO signaling